jgi:hypothetical protein
MLQKLPYLNFVVCFVKGLIEDHRRVSRNSVIAAAEPISQCRGEAGRPLHQALQNQEALFSLIAIVGPGMAECLLNLRFELPHGIKVPVAGADMQVGSARSPGLQPF